MKKKILVIGTSHTYGDCVSWDEKRRFTDSNKWSDLLGADYDVDVLAYSGATAVNQFYIAIQYFIENPDLRYDLAIVEGRGIDTNVCFDEIKNNGYHKTLEELQRKKMTAVQAWQTKNDNHADKGDFAMTCATPFARENLSNIDNGPIKDYLIGYTGTMKHAMDNYSVNAAMCAYLEKFCNTVKWFTVSTIATKLDMREQITQLATAMMDKYTFTHTGISCVVAGLSLEKMGMDINNNLRQWLCACSHFNEQGHIQLYNRFVRPEIENIFKETP